MTDRRLSKLQRAILQTIMEEKITSYLQIRRRTAVRLGLTETGSFDASFSRSIRNLDNQDLIIIYCGLSGYTHGAGVRVTRKGMEFLNVKFQPHVEVSK
jgi:hypothetical protein